MPSTKTLLLTTALSLAASAQLTFGNYSTISNASSSSCPAPGTAHIIVARASGEPMGYGIIGAVKDRVLAAFPGGNAQYVVYPATLDDYFNSESAGVVGMRALVEAYLAQDCGEPLVLMGYSQGAQVTADYLSGQNVEDFAYNASLTEPASEDVLNSVAGVAIMGDPSLNITDNAFHVGNSTRPGIFPRAANSSAVLAGIAANIQSYCDAGDYYCASAGDDAITSVHLLYLDEYGPNATEFVIDRIKEWHAKKENGTTALPTGSDAPVYTGAAAGLTTGMVSVVGLALAIGAAFLVGL